MTLTFIITGRLMTAEIPLQGKKWSEQNLPNIILLQNDVQIPRL